MARSSAAVERPVQQRRIGVVRLGRRTGADVDHPAIETLMDSKALVQLASLDKPAGQQQRLTERMTAVAIARLILFVADAEGFPDPG